MTFAMRKLQIVAILIALNLFAAVGASAHEGGQHDEQPAPYGEPGDPSKPARDVILHMKEGDGWMAFEPDKIDVAKGEQIRFVLENEGELDHEFFFGTTQEMADHAEMMQAMPGMKHADANSMSVVAKAHASVIWHFTNSGEFPFACLIPGHAEAGMNGTIIVK
jgi:uncharacterized cupredoxin-like copper-binding protein